MAELVYRRLSASSVSVASMVRELREQWGPSHGPSAVQGFVAEVGTCLLHYADVEVGDIIGGGFVPWKLEAWDADRRLEEELLVLSDFTKDEFCRVFRKKKSNQLPEPMSGLAPGHGSS